MKTKDSTPESQIPQICLEILRDLNEARNLIGQMASLSGGFPRSLESASRTLFEVAVDIAAVGTGDSSWKDITAMMAEAGIVLPEGFSEECEEFVE